MEFIENYFCQIKNIFIRFRQEKVLELLNGSDIYISNDERNGDEYEESNEVELKCRRVLLRIL